MSAAPAAVPAVAKPQTLDELMLAMDVVDTIRHRELIVERELGQGDRDNALRDRLREIYTSQGIEVTDSVIDQGIKALRESRFVYTPPAPSLGRTLALVWINRGRIVGWSAAILIAIAALWGAYYWGIERPRQAAAEQAAIAAEQARVEHERLPWTVPKRLSDAYGRVTAITIDMFVKARANGFKRRAELAIGRADWDGALSEVVALEGLAVRVAQHYVLRIVSRPGIPSGVYRIPAVNSSARNYYVIVEAIGDDGQPIALPIASEETGKTRIVKMWGERVWQKDYERFVADKEDDGIIQHGYIAEKLRGEDRLRYSITHYATGRITEW